MLGTIDPMTPRSLVPFVVTAGLAMAVVPCPATALDRQVFVAPRAGFGWSSGLVGGPGLAVECAGGYGLSDAFNLYAVAGYTLEFPRDPNSPRHGVNLSAGLSYAFDYLRVVPVISVGFRGDLVAAGSTGSGWITPSAEGRFGLVWMLRRYRALELDVAYAYPFASREFSGGFFSVTVGMRFLRDL